MMKRKGLNLFTILLLVVFLLVAGCSNSTNKTTENAKNNTSNSESKENKNEKAFAGEKIQVLLSAGAVGQFKAWQERSKKFTEETGIEVEYVIVPYENLLESITTDGISGKGTYDVVAYLDTMGPTINQFLQPLDKFAEEDDFDFSRWPEAVVNLSTFDDKVYSVPVRAHVQMLFYRQDIFNQLDIEVPKTWEDIVTAGKKVQENTDLSGIIPYYAPGGNGQNLYMWTAYLWSNGGDIFDENMKPIFNNEKGIEATKRYVNLLLKDNVAPQESITFSEQDARTNFKQGKSAMWLGWWWAYAGFNSDSEIAGNVGFASVPKWEGKDSGANVLTFPMAMMKGSKHKEAAWEYLKWLSDPELELDMVMDTLTNESPESQHTRVLTQTANLKNEKVNELTDGFYHVGYANFENSRTLPMIKEWPQVADILSSAISKIATGEPTESVLNKAAERVDALMKGAGYYE